MPAFKVRLEHTSAQFTQSQERAGEYPAMCPSLAGHQAFSEEARDRRLDKMGIYGTTIVVDPDVYDYGRLHSSSLISGFER